MRQQGRAPPLKDRFDGVQTWMQGCGVDRAQTSQLEQVESRASGSAFWEVFLTENAQISFDYLAVSLPSV